MLLSRPPASLCCGLQRGTQAGRTPTARSASASSASGRCRAAGPASPVAIGSSHRPKPMQRARGGLAAPQAAAGVSAATTTNSTGSAIKVKQEWTITISSTGTGAVDADDDGRRLRLTLLDAHGATLFVGSTDDSSAGAAPWPAPSIDSVNKGWTRSGVAAVEAAAGVQPAVLKVEKLDREGPLGGKGKDAEAEARKRAAGCVDYIYAITVASSTPGAAFSTAFVGQEWVASARAPGQQLATTTKVLWADTLLPQDTPQELQALRRNELRKIRGELFLDDDANKQLQAQKRQGAENIYDYQTYNDLGTPKLPRPTLGGATWPYPRRLATHLATNDTTETIDASPWLPYNERFSFSKKTDFTAGTVSAAVPAIFSGLGHLVDELLNPRSVLQAIAEGGRNPLSWLRELGDDYSSFSDVADHFSGNALPDPLSPGQATPREGSTTASIAAVQGTGSSSSSSSKTDDPLDVGRWLNKTRPRRGPFEADFDDSAPPQPGGAKVAVSTLIGMAHDALLGNLKPEMQTPRVLTDRPADVCFQDEEFGRQFLAGFNPSVISALQALPSELGSAITEEDVAGDLEGATLASLVAAAKAGKKPRLYWVDYWAPYAALFTEEWTDKGKVLHAGRALLFLKQDAAGNDTALIPIALELAAHPSCREPREPTPTAAPTAGTVYSRSKLLAAKQGNVWAVAKLVFRSLDVGVHQLVSHFVRCHAAIEPLLIALRRCISPAHPVFRLLLPHFRYTMSINAAARGGLINADGVIEKTFAPGAFAMRLSSLIYGLTWRFESQALPVDLRKRGMVDASGKPHLSYPYAEDGMRIWSSLERYFGAYLGLYYGTGAERDARVLADEEVQDWWRDVTTKAHPDLTDHSHWGVKDPARLSGVSELLRVLVTIAFTASAHHAAVNFGQYDFTSYPLNAPSLIRRPMPAHASDKAWQDLAKASGSKFETQVLSYINSPATNLLVALTVNLLSTHAQDEHLLDETNTLLTDDAAKQLNQAFIREMQQLEADIAAAHQPGNSWTRTQPGSGGQATWSTCLMPGSVAGLTMRGVPYSVSI